VTSVEHRVEATSVVPQTDYSEREFTPEEIAEGVHRQFIGGAWDTHGLTQLNYLQSRGLKPSEKIVDIGCGCFRAGRHLIDYLDPGNYFGVEANRSLIQAGYDVELSDEQRARLPITNLRANDRFDADFGVQFDLALAQSVFSHVSLNHIRLCLYRLAKVVRPGGVFLATFFEKPPSTPLDTIFAADRRPFFTEQDVFWYYRTDLRWAANFSPWRTRYIGDWGHPAGQRLMEFTRLTDDEWADRRARKTAAATPLARTGDPYRAQARAFVRRGRRWLARTIAPH
jgi:SAM-dependent methyltransferase